MVSIAQETPSLRELAEEVNLALVRMGHANWRREFNARLWACSRDRAIALINEYRHRLVELSGAAISEEMVRQRFSRV